MASIKALGFIAVGQAGKQHNRVGAPGDCERLIDQLLVDGIVRQTIAGGVLGLILDAELPLDFLERNIETGGIDLRAATALVAGRGRERADDRQFAGFSEWQ